MLNRDIVLSKLSMQSAESAAQCCVLLRKEVATANHL